MIEEPYANTLANLRQLLLELYVSASLGRDDLPPEGREFAPLGLPFPRTQAAVGPHEAAWQRLNAMAEVSPENLGAGGIDRTKPRWWRSDHD